MIDSFRPLIEVRYAKVLSSSLFTTLSVIEDEAEGSGAVDFKGADEAPTLETAGALDLASVAATGAPKENPENGLGLFVETTDAGAVDSLDLAGAVLMDEPLLALEPAGGVVAAAGAPKENAANGDFAGAGCSFAPDAEADAAGGAELRGGAIPEEPNALETPAPAGLRCEPAPAAG